jgi:hypothetical protein
MAVEKWMYRTDDDFWDAGFINGPIQQIALLAVNHEAARRALRSVAGRHIRRMLPMPQEG